MTKKEYDREFAKNYYLKQKSNGVKNYSIKASPEFIDRLKVVVKTMRESGLK